MPVLMCVNQKREGAAYTTNTPNVNFFAKCLVLLCRNTILHYDLLDQDIWTGVWNWQWQMMNCSDYEAEEFKLRGVNESSCSWIVHEQLVKMIGSSSVKSSSSQSRTIRICQRIEFEPKNVMLDKLASFSSLRYI